MWGVLAILRFFKFLMKHVMQFGLVLEYFIEVWVKAYTNNNILQMVTACNSKYVHSFVWDDISSFCLEIDSRTVWKTIILVVNSYHHFLKQLEQKICLSIIECCGFIKRPNCCERRLMDISGSSTTRVRTKLISSCE